MNILYIAHERLLGGASLSLVTLADEMKKRGHKVGVVVPFYFSPIAKELRRRGIKTYWVFFGWWMMPEDLSFFMRVGFQCLYKIEIIPAYFISRIVKARNYQIIHSNSSVIDVGSRAAKLAGVQHIWHFREFRDFYKLKFLKGKEDSVNSIIHGRDQIVFISKKLQDYYGELKQTNRTSVIYNGVDKKYINHHIHNNRKIIFLISGNLHRNKRQDLVLQASVLLRDWDVRNFEIWIAGGVGALESSKKYEQELKEYISINQLHNVKMLGRIDDMNLVRSQTDVEIVPSVLEAFGRVTIEAMLSANPVIASDSGANPELVHQGETGWLFESGSALKLAEQMKMIIENPEIIGKMGEKAFQFARDNFLSEKNTIAIEKLYQSLVWNMDEDDN